MKVVLIKLFDWLALEFLELIVQRRILHKLLNITGNCSHTVTQ